MSTVKLKTIVAAACALLFALPSGAQVTRLCVQGTLASYIALGSGGCMFDSVLYHNFSYATPGLTGLTAAQIIVTPALLPLANYPFQGLNFTAPWSVGAGQGEISVIGYAAVPFPPVTAPTPGAASLSLDLGPATVSGIIGSVTVQEKTNVATLEVGETCADACTLKQRDSITITPIQTLQTSITVSLSGGTGGASLKSFASDYAVGPQPE
jgi:hypothetical protein